jgi:protein-tyrosine phosphatase
MTVVSDPDSELSTTPAVRVLMVCTGNICRSPMAESILRKVQQSSALAGRITVDSAGTHAYHVGSPADRRAQTVLLESGYGAEHTARVVRSEWLLQRDLVLAMDEGHLRHLQRLAARTNSPVEHVQLLRTFDPEGPGDVPDPYYDTLAEFRDVLTMIERCMPALLDHLAQLTDPPHRAR